MCDDQLALRHHHARIGMHSLPGGAIAPDLHQAAARLIRDTLTMPSLNAHKRAAATPS